MSDITTMPMSGGLYLSTVSGHVYQFMGDPASAVDRFTAWQRASDWQAVSPGALPSELLALVAGPTLVPAVDEPTGLGAVVTEHDSGRTFIRMGDELWHGPNGEPGLGWGDLAYPVVRSAGVAL